MKNNLNKVSAKEYLTTIRDNLVEQLENNSNKWHKSFINKNMPTNAVTGKHYNSTNFFNLALKDNDICSYSLRSPPAFRLWNFP